jgi:hypothetical protein
MENYSINPITKQKETLDDIALEAPSTDRIRKSSYTGRLLAMGIAALLSYLPMQQRANADMIYDFALDDNTQPTSYQPSNQPLNSDPITLNNGLGWNIDSDPLPFGGILTIEYFVSNTSNPGDANNLIQFSVSAGSSHGVYDAGAASGSWTATINYDNTIFSGGIISPGGANTFSIYSTYTNTTTGTANAVAEGNPIPENFPSQSVPIPVIPEPTTLVLIVGGAGLLAGGRKFITYIGNQPK